MSRNIFFTATVVGLVASVAFILIQPVFGMATLTSRHAAAYVNSGGYGESAALALSWLLHVGVSIFYALIAAAIFRLNSSASVSFVQIVVLGWLTTLIATPANEWVVKLVTTGQFPALASLSAMNTEIGPKLWLHILFFAMVLGGLWLARMKTVSKTPSHGGLSQG